MSIEELSKAARWTWQPIKDAPRNPYGEVSGPPLLVWNSHKHQVFHAFWSTGVVNGVRKTGWFIWSSTGPKYPIEPEHKITHWMPLPSPPQQEQSND